MARTPLDRWIENKVRRGCVPATLRRYRWVVERALREMEAAHRPRDPRRWTLKDALVLKEYSRRDPWLLVVLNNFARFHGNTVIQEAGIPPRGPVHRVRWLRRPEAEALISETRNDPLLSLLVMLGLGQGLRRVEWKRLRVEGVDLASERLLVRGKGRGSPKLVWVPFHPAFRTVYLRYLEHRRRLVDREAGRHPSRPIPAELLVHPSPHGLSGYSDQGLDRLVRKIEGRLAHSGVQIRLSSHMLRRTGATLLEEALLRYPEGAPEGVYRVVQGFLRHENIATTMRYLEGNPGRQWAALEQYRRLLPWPSPPPGEGTVGVGEKEIRRVPMGSLSLPSGAPPEEDRTSPPAGGLHRKRSGTIVGRR